MKEMLLLVVMAAGAIPVVAANFHQLILEFWGWLVVLGLTAIAFLCVAACLQRILRLRLVLTPTELVIPRSPMSRKTTAIPRASITKCQIVGGRRRRRTLVVFHRRGQYSVSEDQLPSSAALDEIFDNLADDLKQSSTAEVQRASVGVTARLELTYGETILWPVPVALLAVVSIVALAAVEPSGRFLDGFPWVLAASFVLAVIAWTLVSNARRSGRILVTESTLSAPVIPGSKDYLSIALSSIRQLDITNEDHRKRKLVVWYSGGGFEILERSFASSREFDRLYSALSTGVAAQAMSLSAAHFAATDAETINSSLNETTRPA